MFVKPAPMLGLRGALSWVSLLTFGLGFVASHAHLAFERHGVCAEHGELVEVDRGGAPHAHSSGESVHEVGSAATTVLTSGTHLERADHDHHCVILQSLRQRLDELRTHRAAAVPQSPAFSRCALDAVGRQASEPLYRLAPKNSPPIA